MAALVLPLVEIDGQLPGGATVAGWSLTSSVTDVSGLPGITVLARSVTVWSRSSIDTVRRDIEPGRSRAWAAGVGVGGW